MARSRGWQCVVVMPCFGSKKRAEVVPCTTEDGATGRLESDGKPGVPNGRDGLHSAPMGQDRTANGVSRNGLHSAPLHKGKAQGECRKAKGLANDKDFWEAAARLRKLADKLLLDLSTGLISFDGEDRPRDPWEETSTESESEDEN